MLILRYTHFEYYSLILNDQISFAGKFISCIGALLGLLLFALVIPILVSTFLEVYEYAEGIRDDDDQKKDKGKPETIHENHNGNEPSSNRLP